MGRPLCGSAAVLLLLVTAISVLQTGVDAAKPPSRRPLIRRQTATASSGSDAGTCSGRRSAWGPGDQWAQNTAPKMCVCKPAIPCSSEHSPLITLLLAAAPHPPTHPLTHSPHPHLQKKPTAPLHCTGLPNAGVAPANSKGWNPDCADARKGIICMSSCQDGYIGAYLSVCKATGWTAPYGKCIALPGSSTAASETLATAQGALGAAPTCTNNVSTACYPEPSTCWGPPPGPNPPNANATFWPAAYATKDGDDIHADCKGGLVGGYVSVCISGNWSTPVGSCYKDPTACWGPPTLKPVLHMEDWCVRCMSSK